MGNPKIAEVGRKTRFKPGSSGNKKGRPKGSRNWSTLVREILEDEELADKLMAKKPGYWEALPNQTLASAIVAVMCLKAIEGDVKAANWLLAAYGNPNPEEDREQVVKQLYVLDMSPPESEPIKNQL